jgi:hypothetical protein
MSTIKLPKGSSVSLMFQNPPYRITDTIESERNIYFDTTEVGFVDNDTTCTYYYKSYPLYKHHKVNSIIFFKRDCINVN